VSHSRAQGVAGGSDDRAAERIELATLSGAGAHASSGDGSRAICACFRGRSERQFTMPITRCYIRIDVTSPDLRSGSGVGYPREVAPSVYRSVRTGACHRVQTIGWAPGTGQDFTKIGNVMPEMATDIVRYRSPPAIARARPTFLRVADHTDKGSGVNDNVLYHSLLGLARGKTFRVELRTRGRRSGRNPSEPYPRIGRYTSTPD
jgi:hypothetical protein